MHSRIQLFLVLSVAVSTAHGQWYAYRDPRTPRMADGKPNLSAPAPRTAGNPDLSGVWMIDASPLPELNAIFPDINAFDVPGDGADMLSKYVLNLLADFKPDDSPLRPEALRIMRSLRSEVEPVTRCLPPGMPRSDLGPAPLKLFKIPD